MSSFLRMDVRAELREKREKERRVVELVHDRQSMCEGKRPYDSYLLAQRGIMGNIHAVPDGRLMPYKCVFCDKFHLGNAVVVRRKERRKVAPE